MELAFDCSRCVGLCCVALAFDRSEHFAYDKPAGAACRHLRGNVCNIHDHLEDAGFGGCARYDCLGAGQRVSAMFPGRRDRAVLDAFYDVRDAHERLVMLRAARNLLLRCLRQRARKSLTIATDARGSSSIGT